MKRALVASLLGVAASVATTYGQGTTVFDNYNASPYMPIKYTSTTAQLPADKVALAGQGVSDAGFSVDLLYFIGTTSNPAQLTDTGLAVPLNPGKADSLGNHGYWDGQNVVIPGYTSGPVTFEVEAWYTTTTGADGQYGGATFGTSLFRGTSALWTESSLATGLSTANTWAGLPGPNGAALANVAIVPEPATLTLLGLGGAALLVSRRRK